MATTGQYLKKTITIIYKSLTKQTRKYSHNTNNDLVFKHLKGDHLGITTIGLNRPEIKNAISMHLLDQLLKTVDRISHEGTTKVLIIHSLCPGTFCAGADLKERAEMSPKQVNNFVINIRNLMYNIYNLPMPVIAALDGVALGGGLEMALAADIRIAS
ncbi:hypothetical protein NQ317_006937 [Molorchus minor]|uniref:Uncharacterized protein n=1 Tax=Molorchus minor TaxID=1323400 RepID=A0ABQ9JM67_9CUCU|nr:hypothetical protein NQ317_006937 [Molorchus minor]